MLLRELDQSPDFVADLENLLTLLVREYDKKSAPAKFSYKFLNQKLQQSSSYGSVNRKIIDMAKEQSDVLSQLIKNYDADTITLNTRHDAPEDDAAPQPDLDKTDQGITKTTQQAASRAASSSL
jgi:deoxyribodipyrimidine photolyase